MTFKETTNGGIFPLPSHVRDLFTPHSPYPWAAACLSGFPGSADLRAATALLRPGPPFYQAPTARTEENGVLTKCPVPAPRVSADVLIKRVTGGAPSSRVTLRLCGAHASVAPLPRRDGGVSRVNATSDQTDFTVSCVRPERARGRLQDEERRRRSERRSLGERKCKCVLNYPPLETRNS